MISTWLLIWRWHHVARVDFVHIDRLLLLLRFGWTLALVSEWTFRFLFRAITKWTLGLLLLLTTRGPTEAPPTEAPPLQAPPPLHGIQGTLRHPEFQHNGERARG